MTIVCIVGQGVFADTDKTNGATASSGVKSGAWLQNCRNVGGLWEVGRQSPRTREQLLRCRLQATTYSITAALFLDF